MGTWGTAISSNDTYADVYGEFFEFYNDGLEVAEISKRLIQNNQELFNENLHILNNIPPLLVFVQLV